jgi:hypothetical protein
VENSQLFPFLSLTKRRFQTARENIKNVRKNSTENFIKKCIFLINGWKFILGWKTFAILFHSSLVFILLRNKGGGGKTSEHLFEKLDQFLKLIVRRME